MEVEEASPARQATVEPKRYQFRQWQLVVDSLLSHTYFIAVEFVPLSTRKAKSDSQLLSGSFLWKPLAASLIIGGKDCKMAARWVADEEREWYEVSF